jgi:multiple inositol-polyphosphate phosphatase / 2,3-bisphosphoglycerate 3-phosphatase
MKISIFTLSILTVTLVLISFTSDCEIRNWGTKTTYLPVQNDYITPPKSFNPVFVNYVGRHGSRHISGIDADSVLLVILQEAEKEGGLREAGRKLKRMDSLLLIIEKGRAGLISQRGQEEQEEIGHRLFKKFSPVFTSNNGTIKISTTKKERTRQSANAFLAGLKPGISHPIINNFNDADNLAFYDVAPNYNDIKKKGAWKSLYDVILNTKQVKEVYSDLPELFFNPGFLQKLRNDTSTRHASDKSLHYSVEEFIDAYYSACSIISCIDKEIVNAGFTLDQLDFKSLVPCASLETLTYLSSAGDFLLKGPGIDGMGLQVRIAAPLLVDFLNSGDEFISTGKLAAKLRFAHAETIAPFATLLDIESACEPVSPDKILEYDKIWKCDEIIPMSANIQWIFFYSKSKNEYVVEVLLNEKQVAIHGLKDSGTTYYYRWTDLKNHYLQKLGQLNIHPGDDMHAYLMNVR